MNRDVGSALARSAQDIEAFLSANLENGEEELSLIFEAMRYSTLAGGKRIRPYLTLSFCQLFGGDERAAMPFAAAVEMIQTYSLIHDDLPCMDDDDYRRGRLTSHKVFGEAVAVLAGDALLTLAFEMLTKATLPSNLIVRAVACLAGAAGCRGMVGGQVMDMTADTQNTDLPGLMRLQEKKTGALICAAAELGCLAAGVDDAEKLRAARKYADGIGRAFQITDDILDVYGNAEKMGKAVGRDAEIGKMTYVSFMSREEAEAEARRLTQEAKKAVSSYAGSEELCAFADFLLAREK